ncbi:hypothetical protein [Sphingobium sp.]
MEKASSWSRMQGCAEMAPDARLDNQDSHAFQKAAGLRKQSASSISVNR